MNQLEEMRSQMAAMKSKLDTQQIVNKELMRKIMSNKASWLNLLVKAELFALPLIFIILAGICILFDISQWYSISFLILGGIDTGLDLKTVRIPGSLFGSTSIIELKRFLVRQKKERFIQTTIMSVISIIWLIMFILSITKSSFVSSNKINLIETYGLIGGSIGISLIVIVILYQKMQRTNDHILADIEELEKDV